MNPAALKRIGLGGITGNPIAFAVVLVMMALLLAIPLTHNGYIEVVNDLGIIGGVCLFGFLLTYLRQSIKVMSFDRHVGSLYVVILFHQFWSSLSESHWFNVNSVSFTIMMLATCCARVLAAASASVASCCARARFCCDWTIDCSALAAAC